jgi:hypothetical protein
VHVVEPHEAEERADTGAGLSPLQRVSVMVFGRLDDRECDIAPPWGIRGKGHWPCETGLALPADGGGA